MDISMHVQSNRGIVSVGKKYTKKEAVAKKYEYFAKSEAGDIYDKWTDKFHLFALID